MIFSLVKLPGIDRWILTAWEEHGNIFNELYLRREDMDALAKLFKKKVS
jgi:hypothetical protein